MMVVVIVTPVPVFLLLFGAAPFVIFVTTVSVGLPATVVSTLVGSPPMIIRMSGIVIPRVHGTTAK